MRLPSHAIVMLAASAAFAAVLASHLHAGELASGAAVALLFASTGFAYGLAVRRAAPRMDAAIAPLRALLADAPLGLIVWTERRGVQAWNDAAERMLGMAKQQALDGPLPDFLAPLRQAVTTVLMQADAAGGIAVTLRNARGDAVTLSASAHRIAGERDDPVLAIVIEDLTPQRVGEARRRDAVRTQRDALVREVHHRIKNHLQGVAGLLRQHLGGKPLLKPLLDAATAQVLTIAAVHGLQGETQGHLLDMRTLVARIAASISGIMHVPIVLGESCASIAGTFLPEEEAVPMAMVLNELLMNAVKHRTRGADEGLIRVGATRDGAHVAIHVANEGFLPPRFDFALGTRVGTGLGLVKSLLPSQGVTLDIAERDDHVVATLTLGPPHLFDRDVSPGHARGAVA